MAIREISTQCTFAEISYGNINNKTKRNLPVVFSSIHSFLSHCANVTQFLWSPNIKNEDSQQIASILNISESYKIKNTNIRNSLEHYDDRLKKWVEENKNIVMIHDYKIGLKEEINLPENSILVRHYDPEKSIFTMLEEDQNVDELFSEVIEIRSKADEWIADNTSMPKP